MSLFLDRNCYFKDYELSFKDRLLNLSWSYFVLIGLVVCIGILLLYSVAGGNMEPWAIKQVYRFGLGCCVFFFIALTDLRIWMKYAYVLYGLSLLLLVAVEIRGEIGMGAQRWLDLGFITLQPSELMKITLVLALARYFHGSDEEDVERWGHLIIPTLLMGIPVGLILIQPDLGTASMLMFVTLAIFFLVGVQWWKFAALFILGLISIPIGWQFLHDYQKERVLTFLNPERVTMPDIDVDLPDDRRDEVIAYCLEKYGKEHIGHIVKLHDNNIYHCRNGHGKYCFPHGGFLKEDLLLPVHEAIPFQRENGRKKAAWANCGHAAFSVREEKFEELENAIFLIAVYPAR